MKTTLLSNHELAVTTRTLQQVIESVPTSDGAGLNCGAASAVAAAAARSVPDDGRVFVRGRERLHRRLSETIPTAALKTGDVMRSTATCCTQDHMGTAAT